jgi:hypothetical protein
VITDAERSYIYDHGYVPEHLPGYVCVISGTEPHLVEDFVVYVGSGRLIFVGYPVAGSFNAKACEKAFRRALKRFQPERVNFIGPHVPSVIAGTGSVSRDQYYLLELESLKIPQKVRNMLTRASKEVTVVKSRNLEKEHTALIDEFLIHHSIDEATQSIFARISEYVLASETATLFEARDPTGSLIAFDVAESGAKEYLFYLFNFSSSTRYVPGASDLMMRAMIKEASVQGKRFINMGLGIDQGVTFFKTKWGARPFLPYIGCEYLLPQGNMVSALLDKL